VDENYYYDSRKKSREELRQDRMYNAARNNPEYYYVLDKCSHYSELYPNLVTEENDLEQG